MVTGCYLFETVILNWTEAKTNCEKNEGHLVEIGSLEEHDALVKEAPGFVWIGLNDRAKEDTWVWSYSGEEPTFTKWNPNEPNNHLANDEDCVALWADFGYNWNDIGCSTRYRSICEGPGWLGAIQNRYQLK